MADRAYIVLNMGGSHGWSAIVDGRFYRQASGHAASFAAGHMGFALPEGARIPRERQASVVHWSRASAEAEALRLQKAVPDGQFVVFESTHVTTTIAGPTHMTLSGQALGQQRFAVLCAVDDEVPF